MTERNHSNALKWCITTKDFNTNDNINNSMLVHPQLQSISFPKSPNDYVPIDSILDNDFRYINSYIYTAVKKRMHEILAAKNTTEPVIELGFEPTTSALPVQRLAN